MYFQFICIEEWPPLSWLAKCPVSGSRIDIYHGKRVETQNEWFCEAIWAGNYESGDFDQTDLIFGSGGHCRNKEVIFVSSGTSFDRLHSIQIKDCLFVSNSLVCLVSTTNAEVDPTYRNYSDDFWSIVKGINNYKRFLSTSAGAVRLTYFHNLAWDGNQLTQVSKPYPKRDFSSFTKYREFLELSLQQIVENMLSLYRKYPYKMLGTTSSGYDSPTVTALARKFGLEHVISFNETDNGESDSGAEIAKILGLQPALIERNAWSAMEFPEIPFLASVGNALYVIIKGAEKYLPGRVLMTGFHGDVVWTKEKKELSEDIIRGDTAGLDLTEYRLWIGFIHFPVPLMGSRQMRDINIISNLPEMLPWNVPGDYNRPICRRIVEGCGVPRNKFGLMKKHPAVILASKHEQGKGNSLSYRSLLDYQNWLRKNYGKWLVKGRIPPCNSLIKMRNYLNTVIRSFCKVLRMTERILPCKCSLADRIERLAQFAGNRNYVSRYLFPWALEKAKRRYSTEKIVISESPIQNRN
ncbi:MAG: hypothetical protein U0586_13895 [Candidatus Brocadiaceae bacterium]